MARSAHDLFDRETDSGLLDDGGVDLLAAEITPILKPFRRRQQCRIDDGRANRGADIPH